MKKLRAVVCLGIILLAAGATPIPVLAEGSVESAASQVKVGTLPLLAALGLGIAVAVGAVVAFLQMTVKGKALGQSYSAREEPFSEEHHDPAHLEPEPVDDQVTDYTIPLGELWNNPFAAEHAVAGEPSLCGVQGEHEGFCYRVLNRKLCFGRDPKQCGIVFPYDNGEISRKHCSLSYLEDRRVFILEDYGSSNGTFLSNGERLIAGQLYELRHGERFSLSGNEHWFEVRDSG